MRHVTQGMIDRYLYRYNQLFRRKGPINLEGLGRRAQLKALRDAMTPRTRRQMRRDSIRSQDRGY